MLYLHLSVPATVFKTRLGGGSYVSVAVDDKRDKGLFIEVEVRNNIGSRQAHYETWALKLDRVTVVDRSRKVLLLFIGKKEGFNSAEVLRISDQKIWTAWEDSTRGDLRLQVGKRESLIFVDRHPHQIGGAKMEAQYHGAMLQEIYRVRNGKVIYWKYRLKPHEIAHLTKIAPINIKNISNISSPPDAEWPPANV